MPKKKKDKGKKQDEDGLSKEERMTLLLKDKLQTEEKHSFLNRKRLNLTWQALVRKTRCEDLLDELITLKQESDRRLDDLEAIMQGLERELREAERQVACGRRLHLQNLQRLRRLQEQCAAAVQRRWQSCLESLRRRFLSERSHIVAQCLLKEADWEDVRFALEQKHRAEKEELHQLYGESMAVLEVARQEQVEAWRLALPAAPQPGPVSLQAAVLAQSNFEMLNDKIRQNQEAKQQQDSESKGPERKGQRVVTVKNTCKKKLKTAVSDLQLKLENIELDNLVLAEQLTAVAHHTPLLRRQLAQDRKVAKKKLTELTVISDAVAKRLKAAIAAGEKVLSVVQLCEKLEREQGTFFTACTTTTTWPAHALPPEPRDAEEFPQLRSLRRRHAVASLQQDALRQRQGALAQENRQLKTLLGRRLDAMVLSGRSC
ncbi:dynein regulatory complex subunit 2-like isoform X1 [Synchiropus splendidus]|uniref:dynein regulatory complex subunit 2-like isoform X1 n=1 Tax=Synchiropus splendidus TaxID=270530 RepID=UPI00237D378F|nr:dynein regulatory complex subunit 2-like isoform X1 [Synchiropus splendidus]